MTAPFLKRFYCETPLYAGATLPATPQLEHRLLHVLRISSGESIALFDGQQAADFEARVHIKNKKIVLEVIKAHPAHRESALKLHLGQGIAKTERMDFAVQKAVEIGATSFTPLITEYCSFKMSTAQLEKKQAHWQSIAIHATEQSGRNHLLTIRPPRLLSEWLASTEACNIFLEPTGSTALNTLFTTLSFPQNGVALTIGPEGGWSPAEIKAAQAANWALTSLGPRILRTETAGIVFMSILQFMWGDLTTR